MFRAKQVFVPRNTDKIDRKFDKLIDGHISGKPLVKSDLIDIDRAVTQEKIEESKWIDYEGFVNLALKSVKASNKLIQKEGYSEIKILPVINVDKGGDNNLFDLPGKRLPKYSFLIGNTKNPVVKILVMGGKHGGESRLMRALLEGLLEIARPGDTRRKLLERTEILFDITEDPWGVYNQTRGAVSRSGQRVNASLVGADRGSSLSNPWGLLDRNAVIGRNSPEALDVMTRSNQAHYLKVFGRKADWMYDAHETCEYTHYPDLGFTYGGILFMVHLYVSDTQLGTLNQLDDCIGGWKKVLKFFNDRNPLGAIKFRQQLLYHSPRLEKIRKIRDRVKELGQRTMEEKYERAIAFLPQTERDIRVDESICIGGMMFRIPQILLGPDVLGYEGNTTESFQQDLFVRAKQTIASLEAQLYVIGLGGAR